MLIFSKIVLVSVITINHRINATFISCSLSLGAFVGGWLSDTLGFEWAATILCFTELFAVSYVIILNQHCTSSGLVKTVGFLA